MEMDVEVIAVQKDGDTNTTRWTRLVVHWTPPNPPVEELPRPWHRQGLSLWPASCS